MIELQKRFFKLIDETIMLNLQAQLNAADSRRYIGAPQWLHEFGTVSIDIGRQLGKTTYIQERMRPCDLVVVHNEDTRRSYESRAERKLPNVVTIGSLRNDFDLCYRYRRNPTDYFNKVYVDEPGMVFAAKNSKSEFINFFGDKCNQLIMIGTPVR